MNLSNPNQNKQNRASRSPFSFSFANLAHYGLTDPVQRRFEKIVSSEPELIPGRVGRVDGISTFVHGMSSNYRAVSAASLRAQAVEVDSEFIQPTVGDWVLVREGQGSDPDVIQTILPRSSLLSRKRANRSKDQTDEQVLAANITSVFVVQAATYINIGRLEREIALVWGSGARPVIVISKTDLLDNQAVEVVIAKVKESAPGVEVFPVSGITGDGTDSLSLYTERGSTVVFIGASGVGKSTLVNYLLGSHVMETREIRSTDNRGRHTTATRQLLPLPGGGVLIDTPGIRSIVLVSGSEPAIAKVFTEVEKYIGTCRFNDCSHENEPDCKVVEAISNGDLSQARFDSYMRMATETEHAKLNRKTITKRVNSHRARVNPKMTRNSRISER